MKYIQLKVFQFEKLLKDRGFKSNDQTFDKEHETVTSNDEKYFRADDDLIF